LTIFAKSHSSYGLTLKRGVRNESQDSRTKSAYSVIDSKPQSAKPVVPQICAGDNDLGIREQKLYPMFNSAKSASRLETNKVLARRDSKWKVLLNLQRMISAYGQSGLRRLLEHLTKMSDIFHLFVNRLL